MADKEIKGEGILIASEFSHEESQIKQIKKAAGEGRSPKIHISQIKEDISVLEDKNIISVQKK